MGWLILSLRIRRRRFESCRARSRNTCKWEIFSCPLLPSVAGFLAAGHELSVGPANLGRQLSSPSGIHQNESARGRNPARVTVTSRWIAALNGRLVGLLYLGDVELLVGERP